MQSIKYRLFGVVAGLVMFLIPATIVASSAAGSFSIRNPETPRQADESPALAAPLAVPERGVTYARLAQGSVVIRPDGVGVGQLSSIPADLPEVETFLPDQVSANSSQISFAVLGNVRYKGIGGQVQVTTIQPSAAAATRPLLLGNTSVKLPDGSVAWLDKDRVAFVRNGLIIAVSGDITVEGILAMAADVVVR